MNLFKLLSFRRGGLLALVAGLFAAVIFSVGAPHKGNAEGDATAVKRTIAQGLEVATFGSGCFWCTESDFDKVKGVVSTVSGYMGGKTANPSYRSVSSGKTGHAEVLQVTFDPKKVSYAMLLDYYWRHADVVDGGGQFCDRGSQYRPVIFTHSGEQKRLADEGKAALDKSGRFKRPVAVEIGMASNFTAAEAHHQNYHKTHPIRYRTYRYGCGRDQRLKRLWGSGATH